MIYLCQLLNQINNLSSDFELSSDCQLRSLPAGISSISRFSWIRPYWNFQSRQGKIPYLNLSTTFSKIGAILNFLLRLLEFKISAKQFRSLSEAATNSCWKKLHDRFTTLSASSAAWSRKGNIDREIVLLIGRYWNETLLTQIHHCWRRSSRNGIGLPADTVRARTPRCRCLLSSVQTHSLDETNIEKLIQFALRSAYAEALEVIPSTLAENAGLNPIATVTDLRNKHACGFKSAGINVRKVDSTVA